MAERNTGTINIYDHENKLLKEFTRRHSDSVNYLDYDGSRLVSGSADNKVILDNTVMDTGHSGVVWFVLLWHKYLVSTANDRKMVVFDLDQWGPWRQLTLVLFARVGSLIDAQ